MGGFMGLFARRGVSQHGRLGEGRSRPGGSEVRRSQGPGWLLCNPTCGLCKRRLLRTAQLVSWGRGSRWGWGRRVQPLTTSRDGARRSFSSPNSIDQEADVAPPPPNLAQIYPCQPRGARQPVPCPPLRLIPRCVERFLSQLLPFLHGNTAAPSLLYGCEARQRGRSCFPPWAWHRPTGSGCSRSQAGAPEPGSIVLSWGCPWEEAVGWEGAGVGERSTPCLPPRHPPPHARAGHGALGAPGWFQLWSPWGELGGGRGRGGMHMHCLQHPPVCSRRLWLRSHTQWHPPSEEGPLSLPG